jgi:nucleotidyltransferase/DNA polymerase involved in DNA repair
MIGTMSHAPSEASRGAPGTASLAAPPAPPAARTAHWDDRPIALVGDGRIRAATAAAGRARVRVGMSVDEARDWCPELDVLSWDDATVLSAVTMTTAALVIASPQVTPVAGAPGMWWVGASGRDIPGGERSLARTLLRVARLWHPRARVAVASSCVAARAATWGDGGEGREVDPFASIIPRGGCAAYLAPAPLGFIPMDDDLRARLLALGVRTVGALAALDGSEVERRWGQGGRLAWRLACGDDWRRPGLARAASRWAVSAELAVPAATIEPVHVLVRAALARLARELAAEGRAVAAVAITLTLDDGRGALPAGSIPELPPESRADAMPHTVTREVRLARALPRLTPLLERSRALLDRWPLSASVCGVTVAVTASEPMPGARAGTPPAGTPDERELAAVLEEVRAEIGASVAITVGEPR